MLTKEERLKKLEEVMTYLDGAESSLAAVDTPLFDPDHEEEMEDVYMYIHFAHDVGIARIRRNIQCAIELLERAIGEA